MIMSASDSPIYAPRDRIIDCIRASGSKANEFVFAIFVSGSLTQHRLEKQALNVDDDDVMSKI